MFKNALAVALSRFKLGRMATAVLESTSEDPEALASVMADRVAEEVKFQLEDNDLLKACKVNGIFSVSDLSGVMESKRLGDKYVDTIRTEATKEAIRAYGHVAGPQVAAQLAHSTPAVIETMRDSWRAEADEKFRTSSERPAERQTKPADYNPASGADPDGAAKPKTAWEQLSAKQQEVAVKQGRTTPEAQEAFAKNLLAVTGVK